MQTHRKQVINLMSQTIAVNNFNLMSQIISAYINEVLCNSTCYEEVYTLHCRHGDPAHPAACQSPPVSPRWQRRTIWHVGGARSDCKGDTQADTLTRESSHSQASVWPLHRQVSGQSPRKIPTPCNCALIPGDIPHFLNLSSSSLYPYSYEYV